jgi:hypothetical protein
MTERKVELCHMYDGSIQFPMRSLDFSADLILPAALWPRGQTQTLTEMSTRNLPGGKGWLVCKVDNLTASCELTCLENVGASMSHNPMGLHGLLQE